MSEDDPSAVDALLRHVAATCPDGIECEALLDRLAGYLECLRGGGRGGLSPADMEVVRAHVEACVDCAEELEALEAALEGLGEDTPGHG